MKQEPNSGRDHARACDVQAIMVESSGIGDDNVIACRATPGRARSPPVRSRCVRSTGTGRTSCALRPPWPPGPCGRARSCASSPRIPVRTSWRPALREVGRIERSLFMLEWTTDPDMRRRAQVGLNKGEAHHALKRAINLGYRQHSGGNTLQGLSASPRVAPEPAAGRGRTGGGGKPARFCQEETGVL